MIKLVATDIDGTILAFDSDFTVGVRNCIKNLLNRGVKVVLVTGRMNAAAKQVANNLGISTPLVSYQGGLIKYNGETLYEKYLTEDQAQKIIEWAKAINIHINLYNNDILYSEKDNETVKHYCKVQNVGYTVKPFSEIELDKVNKILPY